MSTDLQISSAGSSSPKVLELLANHPKVEGVHQSDSSGVAFDLDVWQREVLVGRPDEELYGLIEVIDNNPLVCADKFSVPGPAATLALIALTPLVQSGLLAEAPVLIFSFSTDEKEVQIALERIGWESGVAVHSEEVDLSGMLAATGMASIRTPEILDEIDALYEEQFGRSFYVRRDESSDWGPEVVRGKPFAAYRIRISPDEPYSLLTIRVLADPDGKCGAAQVIHAMNIMCGYEESLGIN